MVERGFGAIRGDLARIACAGYASDLARALVRDHEPHPGLFDLLLALLQRLDQAPAEPSWLRAFELGALRAAGLQPRLDGCARCGSALAAPPARQAFAPEDGGFLCPACQPSAPRALGCAAESAEALRRLAAGGAAAAGPLPGPVAAEIRDLLTRFLEHQLGGKLPSRKFLDEVAPLLK
jgi:DNA repair protein RecO (recombination protein O)